MAKKIKFRAKCFEAYQLNKHRNFLESPRCDCGCGGKALLVAEDDIHQIAAGFLEDHDCPNSAVFLLYDDDYMEAVVKTEDVIEVVTAEKYDRQLFSIIDAEFRLCCYSLMMETEDGLWEIIED